MFCAISFDFWNTLFADGQEVERLALRLNYFYNFVKKKKNVCLFEVEAAFKIAAEYFNDQWRNHFKTPGAAERIVLMAEWLDIGLSGEEIDEISRYFGNLIFDIPPKRISGVHDTVKFLSEYYPLGIISDTGYMSGYFLRRFLEKEGLLQYFKSLQFSDEQGFSKPDKRLFQNTANDLGVSIRDLIHIGDLEETDIIGARASGCISVLFSNNGNREIESKADFILTTYSDLPALIKVICRSS